MSSPAPATHIQPPPPPPKPADYISSDLGVLTPGGQLSSNVSGHLLKADDSYTASVSVGTSLLSVTKLEANNLVLKNSGSATLGWFWQITPEGSSNGVTPLAMKAGQYLFVNVTATYAPEAAKPGPFAGSVILHGAVSGDQTIPIKLTYIGVDPTSPIGQRYQALGGAGFFGDPFGNEMAAPNGVGLVQLFKNGTLWAVPVATGFQVFFVSALIWAKYESLANLTDAFGTPLWTAIGAPTEDTQRNAEGGQAQHFSLSAVFVVRSSNSAAYLTYGNIYECLAAFGNVADAHVTPALGYPISDEVNAGGDWRATHLDSGDIYWSPSTGAHAMGGAIRAAWQVNQVIGFPITDETGTADGVGRFNRFEEGVIYWTPATGAHLVQGAILSRWIALGSEISYLAYPTSDELPWSDPQLGTGRISHFQFGDIAWVASTGAIVELPAQVQATQVVTTPDGTALGGSITLTLKSNGDFTFACHMHDSGVPSYDFAVRGIWTTTAGLSLAFAHSGHVEGTDATTPSHAPNRDDDHTESGNNPTIQQHWAEVQQGQLWVTRDYSADGVIGFVEDLGKGILDVTGTVAGAAAGVVFGLGQEVGGVFGSLGIGGAFGLIAGVVLLPFVGGAGIMMAVVPGVVVGLVTNALVKQRQISDAEFNFVNAVFQGTLPPANQITLTNLVGLGGTAFTLPGADQRIYVNIGDGFDDPMNYVPVIGPYPAPGELFVHEITHVWQIHNTKFLPGFLCKSIVTTADKQVGQQVYEYGPPTIPWNQFDIESQGAIVDQWFGGIATLNAPNRIEKKGMQTDDPYFTYIANNIRKGSA